MIIALHYRKKIVKPAETDFTWQKPPLLRFRVFHLFVFIKGCRFERRTEKKTFLVKSEICNFFKSKSIMYLYK